MRGRQPSSRYQHTAVRHGHLCMLCAGVCLCAVNTLCRFDYMGYCWSLIRAFLTLFMCGMCKYCELGFRLQLKVRYIIHPTFYLVSHIMHSNNIHIMATPGWTTDSHSQKLPCFTFPETGLFALMQRCSAYPFFSPLSCHSSFIDNNRAGHRLVG